MSKRLALVPTALMTMFAIGLTSCTLLDSKYNAIGLTEVNFPQNCSMTFTSFSGTKVFSMKCEETSNKVMEYKGQIESGSITVYYKFGEEKTLLFQLEGDQSVDSYVENLPVGSINVYVESISTSKKGSFKFEIK